jgi:transcriptional regulator with XRE-family HTH domain
LARVTGTTYQAIVGGVIVQLRKDRHITQTEIAERLKMSQSAWSRIEKGFTNLNLEQLTKVATVLGVQPSQIISYADTAKREFEANGINVAESNSEATDWLLLGAAALALIIIASASK